MEAIGNSDDVAVATVYCALKALGVAFRRVGRRGLSSAGDLDVRWRYALKTLYLLTPEQYGDMLIEQSGRCSLCTEPLVGKVDVDHDHVTGKVRGLLHHRCNVALPYIEDVAFREQAIAYLRKAA